MKKGSLPLCRLINICLTPRGLHIYSCMNRVKCNRHNMKNEQQRGFVTSVGTQVYLQLALIAIKNSIDFSAQ